MHLTARDRELISGTVTTVREPARPDVPAQADPQVSATVSAMLAEIERDGRPAVRRYAERLDGWTGGEDFEITGDQLAALTEDLPDDLKAALDAGAERTRRFAEMQRAHLTDFEAEVIPGVVCGQRYIPVNNVGAYLPAGRFPLLASAFMTVGVARAAGVPNVVSCTPPSRQGQPHPAVLYAARASGAERVFALGGVQALAAMAFGLLDGQPADMIVGAGNAYVAEAKRQLYGKVGIDVLAGPSEVAVIADDTATARDGRRRPARPGRARSELARLPGHHLGRAGRRGRSRDRASARGPGHPGHRRRRLAGLGLDLRRRLGQDGRRGDGPPRPRAPRDPHRRPRLLPRAAAQLRLAVPRFVVDRRVRRQGHVGTNHVLPTGRAARYTGGLSVTGYLKQLTYQRATREATRAAGRAGRHHRRLRGDARPPRQRPAAAGPGRARHRPSHPLTQVTVVHRTENLVCPYHHAYV